MYSLFDLNHCLEGLIQEAEEGDAFCFRAGCLAVKEEANDANRLLGFFGHRPLGVRGVLVKTKALAV
jgi:hypothetical protein